VYFCRCESGLFPQSYGVTVFSAISRNATDRGFFVVVALDRDLLVGHHAGAMTRQQHEIERFSTLIDAILTVTRAIVWSSATSGPWISGAIQSTCLQGKVKKDDCNAMVLAYYLC